jgi:hypothetical protein
LGNQTIGALAERWYQIHRPELPIDANARMALDSEVVTCRLISLAQGFTHTTLDPITAAAVDETVMRAVAMVVDWERCTTYLRSTRELRLDLDGDNGFIPSGHALPGALEALSARVFPS